VGAIWSVSKVIITSDRNNRIKYLRKLKKRSFREEEKKFVIEGVRFVEEALQSGWPVHALLCSAKLNENDRVKQLLNYAVDSEIEIWEVSPKLMREISEIQSPQ